LGGWRDNHSEEKNMITKWYEPKRKQEFGVWVLLEGQIERTMEPVLDMKMFALEQATNRAWIVTTEHGAVLVAAWERENGPQYIEYHIWVDNYRYWDRKRDKYQSDAEKINSAHNFARLVVNEINRLQNSSEQ
jgi:hypothetical protein